MLTPQEEIEYLALLEIEARERDKREGENSLAAFVRLAWRTLEPRRAYVHGWHIDAIAEHLEAVTRGEITRLLINVPPGTMKSLLCGVFWPAWEWGPKGLSDHGFVGAAHAQDLAVRDALKMRRLVASRWYQARWPITLRRDQNAKEKFETTAGGFRQAAAAGSITGLRGDRVLIDDPHSVDGAASDAQRQAAVRWFLEAVPTRLNNPETSAIVVIMQRLHERDVSGVILAKRLGYDHLCLPMEYEPERRCHTRLGFADPRQAPGELLFPERFSGKVVARDKKALGDYAWAGQMQQRPVPRDGGLFKRAWFVRFADAAPGDAKRVRAWDLAGTRKAAGGDPDWTVGVKLARQGRGPFYVEHVVRLQGAWGEVERLILSTAEADGPEVAIRLPQDPGQAGKAQAASLIAMLAGFDARAKPPTGDKQIRARPAAAQAEAGQVVLVRGDWVEAFLDELCGFPTATHDDQVDAFADAVNALALEKTPGAGVLEYYRDLTA